MNKDYKTTNVYLYATGNYNVAIGQTVADADLDNTSPVDDTDGYTSVIDLSKRSGCSLAFKFDGNNATDNLSLNLYFSPDNTWTGTEISRHPITVTSDGSEDIYTYILERKAYGAGYYRFSMQSSAGNTTFDVLVKARYWD